MDILIILVGVVVWIICGYLGIKLLLRKGKGYYPGEGGADLRDIIAGSPMRYNESDPFQHVIMLYALAGPFLLLIAAIIPIKKPHSPR
jgi:hypothetical protein